MRIGQLEIGEGHGVYVIAEIGVNHDGAPGRALELVDAAAEAGADAVKLQYFQTDLLMSRSAKLAAYQKAAGESDPISMLRRLELRIEDMVPVVARAHQRGLHAIVTVFSTELVEKAERLAWNAYKTASPDIVHRPLLERLARTGKPLIVSTGAATADEVATSATWLREWGAAGRMATLQCVSSYPTPMEQAELGGIAALHDIVPGPVGYSDHTPDETTGAIAVRMGATLLEKHLTYSRAAKGPDHAASLEPEGLKKYVNLARAAAASGETATVPAAARVKRVLAIEEDVRRVSRQSVVATRALAAGAVLATGDLTIKRPGTGIPAAELSRIPGRRTARAIEADCVIAWEDLA
jgi:N,N'-diacetyllegionaminate synthase